MPEQDIFDKVAAQAPKQDIFDQVAKKQTSQQQLGLPDPAAQSKQQMMARIPRLARDTGLYPEGMNADADRNAAQTKSALSGAFGLPDASYVTPEQAKTAIGTGALAGSAMIAPAATAGGLVGATAGDYGLKSIASAAGASPGAAEMWGTTGGIIGGLAGGEVGARVGSAATKGIMRQIAKLSGETPERIAELNKYFPTKETIEQKTVQAEAQSRDAFKAAYPKIDATPVNMTESRAAAKQAADALVANPTPRVMSQVSSIPKPTPESIAAAGTQARASVSNEVLIKGSRAPDIVHEMMTEDPAAILKRIQSFDNLPFREVQQYRTAIEQYISKARPPANVYNALKLVSRSLGNGLEKSANREGVLDQYQAAEAMFKQHAADFWNKNAPLKPFLNAAPGTKPAQLNRFLQTVNDSRALGALERRGVSTADVQDILAKGSKAIKADVPDAVTLRNQGQAVLNKQVGAANRATAKKAVIGAGGTIIGGGTLYELMKHIATARR